MMILPFTIEYYIKKAKKDGHSLSVIRTALTDDRLWNKVMHKKWSFQKAFDHLLALIEDGEVDTKRKNRGEMITIYKRSS